MKAVALITACVGSSHTPDIFLTHIDNKPVIQHCYESVLASNLYSEIKVITNNNEIATLIKHIGGQVISHTKVLHSSIEAVADEAVNVDADLIVHIQGNVPYLNEVPVDKLLELFNDSANQNIQAASAVYKIQNPLQIHSMDCIKAVLNLRLFAMYFSRYPVPFLSNTSSAISHYAFTGVMVYRFAMLLNYINWPVSPLEKTERVEPLRLLENGVQIKMHICKAPIAQINSVEDVAVAN